MDAALALGFVEATQIENKAADDGEIGPGILYASAHLVVVESDIETPVDLILDAPMGAHHIGQFAGVRGDTGDKPGDSFDKLSRECGTTIETFQKLNPTARILHPGDVLKYQKAALRKVITGWKSMTTASIATLYNVSDPAYSRKLDYALSVLQRKKDMACVQ